jgi:hypothetical protein
MNGGQAIPLYPFAVNGELAAPPTTAVVSAVELPSVRFGDLTPAEFDDLRLMLCQWSQRLQRNSLRLKYYDGKNRLKDLGIAIPPSLKNVETVIGWPAKAVDALAARSSFDGFVAPSGEFADGVNALFDENDFTNSYRQATTDELVCSCSFITLSGGAEGEPKALLTPHAAQTATGIWDGRHRRLRCGLSITRVVDGRPVQMSMFTDTAIIAVTYDGLRWRAERAPHRLGVAPMEVLAYRPSLARPFGKSRISRAVMSITDSAVRCALRTEVAAEFYTTPQKYVLGVEEGTLKDSEREKWETYIGNIFALTKGEDGDRPEFGQLPQMTMQPHIDYMRSLAARFAGETSIPISSLGVIHDNPASAEAIYAAKEDLIIETTALNASNGRALKSLGLMVAAMLAGRSLDGLDDEQRAIAPRFKNPSMPSVVSQSDAMVKQIAAIPWIASSRVALEELGYTEEQITRMLSEKRRAEALTSLSAAVKAAASGQSAEADDAE